MKIYYLAFVILLSACQPALNSSKENSFEKDKTEILNVLDQQQKAWNAFDLESFMQGYWKSDDLKFYGSNGVTFGWHNTLLNYQKRYPSKEDMGELNFTIDVVSNIEKDSYYVMGKYHLIRNIGDAQGTFMVIFKKINGKWKIIADSSC